MNARTSRIHFFTHSLFHFSLLLIHHSLIRCPGKKSVSGRELILHCFNRALQVNAARSLDEDDVA